MGAPAGADGGHRAGLHPARHADLAAAGEADDDRPDVPLRPAPGRPLPPVLAVRRRGDRRSRTGDRCRADRARPARSTRLAGLDGGRRPPELDRRWDLPAGLHRSCLPTTTSRTSNACRRSSAERLYRQSAATARLEGPGHGRAERRGARGSPTTCAGRAGLTSTPSAATSTLSGSPTSSSQASSAASTTTPEPRSSSTATGREGQQQALGGGGRYDGLVELLGGRPTPGIGFGLGLDRVVLALQDQSRAEPGGRRQPGPDWPSSSGADPADTATRLRVATDLRAAGIAARADLGPRKLGRQLESAARERAHFVVIIGDELADGNVQLKDLEAGSQQLVALDDLARKLVSGARSHRHGIERQLTLGSGGRRRTATIRRP